MEHAKRPILTIEHLVGGVLLSASIFLGGLALTVMSTKIEENKYE